MRGRRQPQEPNYSYFTKYLVSWFPVGWRSHWAEASCYSCTANPENLGIPEPKKAFFLTRRGQLSIALFFHVATLRAERENCINAIKNTAKHLKPLKSRQPKSRIKRWKNPTEKSEKCYHGLRKTDTWSWIQSCRLFVSFLCRLSAPRPCRRTAACSGLTHQLKRNESHRWERGSWRARGNSQILIQLKMWGETVRQATAERENISVIQAGASVFKWS